MLQQAGCVQGYRKKHVGKLIELAKSNSGEKELTLPFGFKATKTYDTLVISKMSAECGGEDLSGLEIPFRTGKIEFGSRTVTILPVSGEQVERNALLFDAGKLPDGVILRTRREGDFFTKFGGGTKKLKDFLIDKKYPEPSVTS